MDAAGFLSENKTRAGRQFSLASGAAIAGVIFLLAQCWALARLVDGVLFGQMDTHAIWSWVAIGVSAAALRYGAGYISDSYGLAGAAIIKNDLRQRLLDALIAKGPSVIGRDSAGRWTTAWTEAVDALQDYYARYMPARLQTAILPLAVMILVFPLDWVSALIFTVTAPLIPFFMIMVGKGAEKLNRRQWKRLSFMSGYLLDLLQGLKTIRLFDAGAREAALIRRISDDYRLETMKILSVAFLSSLLLEFLATVSIALVAVLMGFRLLWGQIDFFHGFFVLLLAPEFYLPLRRMGVFYHARMQALAAAETISDALDGVPAKNGTGLLTQGPLTIVFENVSFSYDGTTPVLIDVSFTLTPGMRMAVVGPSGAGKSTIFFLLMGFVRPTAGRILVNGVDLALLDLDAYRQNLSFVPQQPHLFDGSLYDNIRFSNTDASHKDIIKAAKMFMVDDVAQSLPDGYDGHLGEGGARLSGGQVQRVALARGFLRDASIYLLDEPTARLDRDTENIIQQSMASIDRRKTLLVAAHRLSTLKEMDLILVMDKGRIVAQGTHDALIATDNLYREGLL